MVPLPRSSIPGSTAWVRTYTAVRLTAITLSHSWRSTQRIERAWLLWPALLTSTSTRPNRSSVQVTKPAAASEFSRSTTRATHRPPSFSMERATASTGACRRPQITTCAPSAASSRAVTSPIPLPPPVTIATCPFSAFIDALLSSRSARSLPRPHRLLEMINARGPSVHDHLTHLVDHRRGRRVNERRQDRQLDDGPIALGDGDQDRHLRSLEIVERHVIHVLHLVRVRRQRAGPFTPHHDGRDDEPRARRIVVQHPEHRGGLQRQPDFFLQLAQGRRLRALPGIDAPAGERPLPRVGPQPIGTP